MADRETLMRALRNAHNAGDEDAARRIAGMITSSQEQAPQEPSGIGDTLKSFGSGVVRGATGLLDLPAYAAQAGQAGIERGYELVTGDKPSEGFMRGLTEGVQLPVIGELTRAAAGEAATAVAPGVMGYEPKTTAGEYAQTVGEFLPGAVGGGAKAAGSMVAAGLASEAAGQATEGTELEPYARVAGAFFAPVAIGAGNKTVSTMFNRASQKPSLDTLRDAKNAAYRAVDASGVKVPASLVDDLASKVDDIAAASNYVPEVDRQTFAAIKAITSQRGRSLTIGQLDKLRQGLWKRYNAAPNEVAIRDMIDLVDDAIAQAPGGGELMATARLANSRYKKAELLENAFQKASDQAASTGSGGNTVNKFRQAVTRIINNPRDAKFFSKEEIDFMRKFVQGSLPENTMRLMGKISPSGNGLMLALNIGAIAANPAMAGLTAAGAGAKAASDMMAAKGAEAIKSMAATGRVPAQAQGRILTDTARTIPGLLAQ